MATTLAKLEGEVTIDTGNSAEKLEDVGNAVSDIKKGIEDTQTATVTFKDIMGGAGSILSGFFSNASEELTKAWPEIREVVAGAQRLDLAMASLGQGGQQAVKWINELQMTRGYDASVIKDWYLLATNMGMTNTQTQALISGLADFGVVEDKTAADLEGIVQALGRMNESGMMSGRLFDMLGRKGASMRSVLATSFGVSTDEIDGMVKQGLIPADEALESFIGWLSTFQGEAVKWEGTLPGLTARVEGFNDTLIEALARPAVEALTGAVSGLLQALTSNEVIAGIQSVGAEIGIALTAGISGIGVTAESLFGGVDSGLSEFIEKFKTGDWGSSISDLVINIQFGVMEAAAHMKSVGQTIFNTGQFLIDALKILISELGDYLSYALGEDTPELKAARGRMAAAPLLSVEWKAARDEVLQLAADASKIDLSGIGVLFEELTKAEGVAEADYVKEKKAIDEGRAAALLAAETQRELAKANQPPVGTRPLDVNPEDFMLGAMTGVEDVSGAAKDLVDNMRGAVATAAATPSPDDAVIAQNLMSGVAKTDLSDVAYDGANMMGVITAGINTAIVESSQQLYDAGVTIFNSIAIGIEAGFAAGAKTSNAFKAVLEGMVTSIVASIVTD